MNDIYVHFSENIAKPKIRTVKDCNLVGDLALQHMSG